MKSKLYIAIIVARALNGFNNSSAQTNRSLSNLTSPTAVNDAVKRGFVVFNTEVKCIQCHFGSNFTTNEFRNIGLFNGKDLNDSGRAVISHVADDIGKFKVAA
jgi:cytochrome c peroxidase